MRRYGLWLTAWLLRQLRLGQRVRRTWQSDIYRWHIPPVLRYRRLLLVQEIRQDEDGEYKDDDENIHGYPLFRFWFRSLRSGDLATVAGVADRLTHVRISLYVVQVVVVHDPEIARASTTLASISCV